MTTHSTLHGKTTGFFPLVIPVASVCTATLPMDGTLPCCRKQLTNATLMNLELSTVPRSASGITLRSRLACLPVYIRTRMSDLTSKISPRCQVAIQSGAIIPLNRCAPLPSQRLLLTFAGDPTSQAGTMSAALSLTTITEKC